MKPVLVILFVLVLCNRCRTHNDTVPNQIKSVTVSVITDLTDKQKLTPVADPLLQLYQCDLDPDKECKFKMHAISDKVLNPAEYTILENRQTTESKNINDDPLARQKLVLSFYNKVRQMVQSYSLQQDTAHTLMNSECIRTITGELTALSKDTSTMKYLVVYSDLQEKSDLFDVYQQQGFGGQLESIAEKNELLPYHLNDIIVILVFEPKDREQDIVYREIAAAYKRMIEKKGGKVVVQASNMRFEL